MEKEITRKYIETLDEVEPCDFDTYREERWFNVGLKYGLEAADNDPVLPWISTEDDLPYKHKELVYRSISGGIELTCVVIVKDEYGNVDLSSMYGRDNDWKCALNADFKYWFPVSALEAFTRK